MDCPQCDEPLATYALGGRESFVCENCGYVGIEAEHRGTPRRVESWTDAIRRFYAAHGVDEDPTVLVRPSGTQSSPEESWAEALQRFHDRRAPDVAADVGTDGEAGTGAAADGDAGEADPVETPDALDPEDASVDADPEDASVDAAPTTDEATEEAAAEERDGDEVSPRSNGDESSVQSSAGDS